MGLDMSPGTMNRGSFADARDALRPYWIVLREFLLDTPVWYLRGRPMPAPRRVKNAVLARNAVSGSTWVETGTYLGRTTQFLSGIASHVYSLEPARSLYMRAARKFSGRNDVTILNESSEEGMLHLLTQLKGPTAFWLDGHYSDGVTYLGDKVTPIEQELDAIDQNFDRLCPISIMVDDIRLFGVDPGYPPLALLTSWAEKRGMACHIEHDILVMRTPAPQELADWDQKRDFPPRLALSAGSEAST